MLIFKVTDRLGDYGLVGIASLAIDSARASAQVVDFLLSCRVFGRRLEESMFQVLEATAQACGAAQLVAEYHPTPKNGPCLTMLNSLGLEYQSGGNCFASSLPNKRTFPDCVKLKVNGGHPLATLACAT